MREASRTPAPNKGRGKGRRNQGQTGRLRCRYGGIQNRYRFNDRNGPGTGFAGYDVGERFVEVDMDIPVTAIPVVHAGIVGRREMYGERTMAHGRIEKRAGTSIRSCGDGGSNDLVVQIVAGRKDFSDDYAVDTNASKGEWVRELPPYISWIALQWVRYRTRVGRGRTDAGTHGGAESK